MNERRPYEPIRMLPLARRISADVRPELVPHDQGAHLPARDLAQAAARQARMSPPDDGRDYKV